MIAVFLTFRPIPISPPFKAISSFGIEYACFPFFLNYACVGVILVRFKYVYKMTEIVKIDNILRLLATDLLLKPYAEDWQILEAALKKYPELDKAFFGAELQGILDKLVEDKNVKRRKVKVSTGDVLMSTGKEIRYSITFAGNLYFLNGGYKERKRKDTISANLQFWQTVAIAVGTVLAAMGTIGLWLFEYLKYNKTYPFGIHSLHKFFFDTSTGICSVLVALLSVLIIIGSCQLKRLRKNKLM